MQNRFNLEKEKEDRKKRKLVAQLNSKDAIIGELRKEIELIK